MRIKKPGKSSSGFSSIFFLRRLRWVKKRVKSLGTVEEA
jgi:hypothetical protein